MVLKGGGIRAQMLPKQSIFELIVRTQLVLQLAASAISESLDSLDVISLIRLCCDFARFGTIRES